MSTSASLRGTRQAAEERRAFPRRSVMDRRLVTVNLDNLDAGLMVDLSEGGMAVQALARIKPGANTSLQFELPDTANRIETRATVVWVDVTSGRAGLRFENLSEAAAGSLRKWLRLPAQDRPASKPAPPVVPAAAVAGSEVRAAEVAALQREISSRGLDREAALPLIANRIRTLVRADGVAIVLGDTRGMTCRASSGSAPPVGTDLLPESGLSGECVRTGVTVRSDDTERDARVDRDACRAINLRSAVVVPLFARGNINGLVEVFYAAPCAFDGRDVLTLRRLADLISATLSTSAAAESRQMIQDASAATGQGYEPASVPPLPAMPVSPPAPRAASQTNKAACQVCGHPNPPAARSCEKCQGPLAGAFSAHPTAPLPWMTLRLNVSPRLLILIALVLLLIGILGWQEYKSRGTHAPAPLSWSSSTDAPASH